MSEMPKQVWAWAPYKDCSHGYFLTTDTVNKPISAKYIRADLVDKMILEKQFNNIGFDVVNNE